MIIYKATNTINGKCYIGKTTGLLDKRRNSHLSSARKGVSYYFYNAIRKYGESAFEWNIIDSACETEEELNEMEYHYIMQYKTHKSQNGYNTCWGGEGACRPHTEEAKQKMSIAHKGKVLTEEHIRKIVESRGIQYLSEETKKKIGDAHRGRVHTEQSRKNMSDAHMGITLTEEAKQRMSDARKGEKHHFYGVVGEKHPLAKMYKITRPDGVIEIITGLAHYCKQNGLSSGGMCEVSSGKRKYHHGYMCEKITI
jgi:group I intron endonuclease